MWISIESADVANTAILCRIWLVTQTTTNGTKRTKSFGSLVSAFGPKTDIQPGPITPLSDRRPVGIHLSTTHINQTGGDAHAQTAKQGYPMGGIVCSEIASDKERETYPIVYFEDLALGIPVSNAQEPSSFRPEVVIAAFDKAIDAAAEGTRLLQGEMIGIAQRNFNALLNQLRKLAGAKSLGEILDLQAAYCRNQLGAFIRQVEEIQAVSTEVAHGLAKPIETHVSMQTMNRAGTISKMSNP